MTIILYFKRPRARNQKSLLLIISVVLSSAINYIFLFQGCHLQPMAKKDKIGGPEASPSIINPLAAKGSSDIPILRKKKHEQ